MCSGIDENERPVVFLTHMEHHSNHTSWLENEVDVIIIEPDDNLLVNPENLRIEIEKYKDRIFKIGSFSACSNVTGIIPPYYKLARIMHEYGGYCFIDFAASAPYLEINMHPEDPLERLDAIYFSPHKFLGGPGSSGVLIFNRELYKNVVPDQPGGGTVKWTNMWGKFAYLDDIEQKEDGGTPGFLQAIKTALCIKLKEEMLVDNIKKREKELLKLVFNGLKEIPGLHILADNVEDRLGILSFYVDNIHFNLIVKLLNDRFGIQTRGGCSCAGTYGHFLLHVDKKTSKKITDKIDHGDLSNKPGWVRISIHPVTLNSEIHLIISAIKEIVKNIDEYSKDYLYSIETNEFNHKNFVVEDFEKYIPSFEV
ncbi:aminotransferase class V-fold PLP-dependent enzyme [Bacteroidota bacterium]